jgi:ATP-dependent Lhr-like helicase
VNDQPRLDMPDAGPSGPAALLPKSFLDWFRLRGWSPRAHQLELLAKAQAGNSVLLIAPTGAGKTLAGFMPTLTDLAMRGKRKPGAAFQGIHTLYISPLKALAVDIERNLTQPVAEIGLPITLETRTGDTPQHKRSRQKLAPPDILLTTPEQLALLIASQEARSSARARPGAAETARAGAQNDRAVGDCGRARRTAPLAGEPEPAGADG